MKGTRGRGKGGDASNFGCGFGTTLFQLGLVLFLPQHWEATKKKKLENPIRMREKV